MKYFSFALILALATASEWAILLAGSEGLCS